MIRSMTGFGAADRSTPAGRLQVELRTVNHRYLNVNARVPTVLAKFEPELREWLRPWFARGHVNCTVRLAPEEGASTPLDLRLDEGRAATYLTLLRQLAERFQLAGEPELALLARYNDIFVRGGEDATEPVVSTDDLRSTLDEAARQNVAMREDEGRRLGADLRERLAAIEQALDVILERAPERLTAERDRLREAILDLSGGVALDDVRLAQEIALLAERLDINEEIVRFRSHLELFRELLDAGGAEPVGKRLGFLVQEMHRESNTIGSKANDAVIAHRVIAIKEEVERLREQVENVE